MHGLSIHVDVFSDVRRYPDDVYDRVWSPFFLPEWTQITTSLDVNNSNNYEPPKAALTSAATPGDNGTRLTINWTLDNPDEQIHLYVHFAELEPVGENTDEALRTLFTRTFYFVVNGKISYDESITPLDLAVSTVETVVNKCDGGNCSLQLVRSEASPGVRVPLVNAMEAFTAIKFPHSETNPDDGTYVYISTTFTKILGYMPQTIIWNAIPLARPVFCSIILIFYRW